MSEMDIFNTKWRKQKKEELSAEIDLRVARLARESYARQLETHKEITMLVKELRDIVFFEDFMRQARRDLACVKLGLPTDAQIRTEQAARRSFGDEA